MTATKRHHDQDNSYKRNNLIGDLLTVSETLSIIMAESMAQAGRHSGREVAESYILIWREREEKERETLWVWHELLKPQRPPQ